MKRGLTDRQVKHIKPVADKRLQIPAGPPSGLYLVVHPTGSKSWIFRYRYRGRTRGLTFRESYPDLSVAQARAEADAALTLLEQDFDPAVAQVAEVKAEEPDTVKAVAHEWIERDLKKRKTRSWPEVKRILDRDVLPGWPDRYITEIGRADILRLIDAIVDSGRPVLANRTLSILKRFFKWAVMRGYIDTSPAAVLTPPARETSRDRVLTNVELEAIWRATPEVGFPSGDFIRLLILTGQRRSEVANMTWDQVDLRAGVWTLPAESTKARRIHDVPLSPAAVALLAALPRFEKGRYVWTTTGGERPISGFSKAKDALDKAITKSRDGKALANWTLHDCRRTMTTWMAEHKVLPHVLAAVLNHSPGTQHQSSGGSRITAVYARNLWAKEKREALDAWGNYVVTLGKPKLRAKGAA